MVVVFGRAILAGHTWVGEEKSEETVIVSTAFPLRSHYCPTPARYTMNEKKMDTPSGR